MRVLPLSCLLVSLLLMRPPVALAENPPAKSPDLQTIGSVTSVVSTTPVVQSGTTYSAAPLAGPRPVRSALLSKPTPIEAPVPHSDAVVAPRAPRLADLFGRIPRPEWESGAVVKPGEIVTIGPATSVEPPLRPLDTVAPAARRGPKALREKTTSLPRPANAPSPSLVKGATPEVKP